MRDGASRMGDGREEKGSTNSPGSRANKCPFYFFFFFPTI